MTPFDESLLLQHRDDAVRSAVLVELGSPVARIYRDPGRPHLEWVQLFTPDGQHLTLQRAHAVRLADAIHAAFGATT